MTDPLVDDPVMLTGLGAVTPVGHDATTAFTSVKAGIARIGEQPDLRFLDDRGKRQFVACGAVQGVTDGQRRYLRLHRMALRAFGEAVAQAQLDAGRIETMPVFLGVAEPERPGWDTRVDTRLVAHIHRRIGVPHDPARTTIVQAGHAAIHLAMAQALATLADGATSRVIVGAVDSYLDEFTLEWLNDTGRLKHEGRSIGFIPGEGAAFIVLERSSVAQRRGAIPLARLHRVGTAFEDNGIYGDQPCLGDGLTQALQSVLAGVADGSDLGLIVCDLNGERHRAHEWSLAMQRCLASGATPPLWHPADGSGDSGAASGAIHVVLAAMALSQGHAGSMALAWASSDDGERGAALMTIADPERPPHRRLAWA